MNERMSDISLWDVVSSRYTGWPTSTLLQNYQKSY